MVKCNPPPKKKKKVIGAIQNPSKQKQNRRNSVSIEPFFFFGLLAIHGMNRRERCKKGNIKKFIWKLRWKRKNYRRNKVSD